MEQYAIFWIANGFDPGNGTTTDSFSRIALNRASDRFKNLQSDDNVVKFVIVRSIVMSGEGTILWNVLEAEAKEYADIPEESIVVTETETTGSTTDGLAITKYASEHPDTFIEVFTASPQFRDYVDVMYRAVARWVEGRRSNLPMKVFSAVTIPHWKSRLLYRVLWGITACVSKSGFLFIIWYNLLNTIYKRRLTHFERTIS
ncbi:MAG: hypothetical protein COU90_02100 [Candidatus Ryanbacteria bacterium CG10_big_fil_rev_8_21_14_0_10_43_42]|uniref:DUF218 domain-containing protein n=1 Tax=Candidatus Ryanbacteria bacterium CG10_big_fil_rev_8_21_14_0_10_43_42 TaxID=1974864 RepID=A0A2M8KXF9_9BACT|nr:MAG: hypothetical protein COU90_02100 [Candidatus Ryanbacteria bacterium CG10_big_fil_rev_8_21_14_0_10_43_42]